MTLARASAEAYEKLCNDLDVGVFAAGSRLPGERQLAERLGVSRATLRTALGELEAHGRLRRSAQRGWFVPALVVGEPPSTLQSFTEMAHARGLRPSAKVLLQAVRPASLDEATKLRIAPASPVITIRRLRSMDGSPICVDSLVLPRRRVEGLESTDLTDASLYEVLQRDFGIDIRRSSYSVTAMLADKHVARLLGMTAGEAVLVGDEVASEADGSPVLVGSTVYRGDAYRFEADLFRTSTSPRPAAS